MHRSRVLNEIRARPRISGEELGRQQVSLQSIAARTGEDDVARYVRTAVRPREHMIERGELELERRRAVHTAAAAIAHGGALDRALLMTGGNLFGPASDARDAGERDMVELPTSGQCHLAKKATPRTGNLSRGGVSRRFSNDRLLRGSRTCRALMVAGRPAAIDMLLDVG